MTSDDNRDDVYEEDDGEERLRKEGEDGEDASDNKYSTANQEVPLGSQNNIDQKDDNDKKDNVREEGSETEEAEAGRITGDERSSRPPPVKPAHAPCAPGCRP